LYSSVELTDPDGLSPPVAKPAVCVPAPVGNCLAVAKEPPVVQLVPSYSYVAAVIPGGDCPPNAKPAVAVPAEPLKPSVATGRFSPDDHAPTPAVTPFKVCAC
jgi:hypothetical protein